jgi:diguanylate cyclase
MLDLDDFKRYNDRFGHLAGDRLLRTMSAAMAQRIRGQDLMARYGGEEFCVVLRDTDLDGALQVIEAVKELARTVPAHRAVSLSAGVAAWDGEEEPEALVRRADEALYRAKTAGRNRVVGAVPAAA